MGAIPEKYLRVALIVASAYFIVAGIFSAIYYAPDVTVSRDVARARGEEDEKELRADAIAAVIVGCLEAAFGAYGLIAVLLKRRLLLIIFAGILVLAVVGNLILMIWVSIDYRRTKRESLANSEDNMLRLYGNRSDDASVGYTMVIDNHQRTVSCCGWSNDPNDNIYLRTPFFKYMQNRDPKSKEAGNDRTLPESCCIKVSSECYRTKDLKKARADKLVYKFDCLELMVSNATLYLIVTLFKAIFASLVQIVTITASVLHVLQIV